MTDTRTALLEKEIARLNLIIEALVFENQALKRGYSISETGNASPNVGYSVSEKGNGIPNDSYSVAEKDNGIPNDSYSISEKGNGIPNSSYSVNEKGNGISNVGRPLPEKIDPASGAVYNLNQKLRAMEKGKVKRSGSINSAKLLIHFHNKSNSDHPTLRKLTNLSEGGLGKMIMSLKKRGLIIPDGWQKFALTPNAKKLMSEALSYLIK
jgi:hypothetical protein